MNKHQFTEQLAAELGLTFSHMESIVDRMLKKVMTTVTEGEEVLFSGFGKFSLRNYKQRTGYNPRTKLSMVIPGQKNVKFMLGEGFKNMVNLN